MRDDAWEAFCEVVAEEDRDSILTAMSEYAHTDKYAVPYITIHTRDRHNTINVTIEGTLHYKGEDYDFHLQDGDMNGTDLRGFNGHGIDYEPFVPDPYSFQPSTPIHSLSPESAILLLKKWQLFKDRRDVQELIRKYSYDAFMQPGIFVNRHYRDQAQVMGIEIVRESTAKETEKELRKIAGAA